MPSEFSMTFGVEPSITATQELVVPRSIPMTLAMIYYLSFQQAGPGPCSAPAQAGGAGEPPTLLDPTPQWITCGSRHAAAPCGALAHIGERWWPARQTFTKMRVVTSGPTGQRQWSDQPGCCIRPTSTGPPRSVSSTRFGRLCG